MTKSKYLLEIKEREVHLLLEYEKDYPSTWAVIIVIALNLIVPLKHFLVGIRSDDYSIYCWSES